jgi:hypothetical protein
MSCGGCHLDGFTSTNAVFFEALRAADPGADARIGHVGLKDLFSTTVDPTFDPHDILVAFLDQGGLAPDRRGDHRDGQIDPSHPTPDAATMARQVARVIARDLRVGPSWELPGDAPNLDWDQQFCGQSACHQTEYAAWSKSVHAHAAEDPMVLFGITVEQKLEGDQYARLCAGCHDPLLARHGTTTQQAPPPRGGITCLGCHDVVRAIGAGGNGDLEYASHDWSKDHKAWGLASLERLRKPEFCGGCHRQFVPSHGIAAITTLDEYRASPFNGSIACVDCHMPKNDGEHADHGAAGGNLYMGHAFGDDALVAAQTHKLQTALELTATRAGGGVYVFAHNKAVGHGFPTGVTDIREPWVEIEALDANKNVLATYGGPGQDALLPSNAARLGIDIAKPDGTVLLLHELSAATRITYDLRIPAQATQALFVPIPQPLPQGTKELDAVLRYRLVRTPYYQAATNTKSTSPELELARTPVP